MSPELKPPLQLKEIQPLQQNYHQPQVKLLFSSPTTHTLTAPTRAFTGGLYLASQPAALLQFISFPLQTCLERFSYSFWSTWPPCPNPDLQQKEVLSFTAGFTTFTSSSHCLQRVCRTCRQPFCRLFSPWRKSQNWKWWEESRSSFQTAVIPFKTLLSPPLGHTGHICIALEVSSQREVCTPITFCGMASPQHVKSSLISGKAVSLRTAIILAGAQPTSVTDGFGQKTDTSGRKGLWWRFFDEDHQSNRSLSAWLEQLC